MAVHFAPRTNFCIKNGLVLPNYHDLHVHIHRLGSEPFVRHLFRHLRGMVESVGPVHVQAYRDHVAFLVRVRFISATPKKRWLDIGFWFPRRLENPRFRKVETLTPVDHIHILRITHKLGISI